MNFVKFTEYNDHEGETWNFWLQLDGNEVELSKLQSCLISSDNYQLSAVPVDESEVDILVKHTDSGYMYYDNKVTGQFTCPEPNLDELVDYEWLDNHFYKGHIMEYFD